jgi:hypothetical protein
LRAPSGEEIAAPPEHASHEFLDLFHRGKRRRKELAMRSTVRFLVVAASVLLLATAASAQTVTMGKDMSLTIKGFISATAFAQDQNFAFGNGQNAEFPTKSTPAGHDCIEQKVDCWFGGGDVRNTRLTLVFNGPKVVGDFKVGGTIEIDFFGGFNGTGAFSGQQPNPRLRLAYADLTDGSTTIRIGQQWSPIFGNVAVSLSHIAFPLGYGSAGDIGWRFPGISLIQELTGKDSAVKASVQGAILSGTWSGPGDNVNYGTAGNASWPQFELRFNLGGKMGESSSWSTYVAGHIDEKDLSGAGASTANDKLTGSAVEIGAKFQIGPVMIQGNGYTGHSIGNQFGMITQFGKIQGQGGWAQIGIDFTKNWSIFGFWGIDNPKDSDVLAAHQSRLKNIQYAGMLRWKAGPYALGFEYIHDKLTTSGTPTVGPPEQSGTQLALSAFYAF